MPKRAAPDTDAPPNTRAKKAAKTEGSDDTSKKAKAPAKKAPTKKKVSCVPTILYCIYYSKKTRVDALLQGVLSAAKFKSQALPIHVHLTHTPAPVEKADVATDDPGFLGSLTLVPTKFQTGSYGWKATRKVEVELENPEEGQPKLKVSVQFQINAVSSLLCFGSLVCFSDSVE